MKKMVILNGSPRGSKGATGVVVNDMQSFIPEDISVDVLELMGDGISESLDSEQQQKLYEADILMFTFPLYVDIFPANLLYCAREMEAQSQRICRAVVKSAAVPGIIVTGEQDKIPALSRDLGDRQRDVFYACVHLAGKLRKKLFSFCLIYFQLPDQFLPAGL